MPFDSRIGRAGAAVLFILVLTAGAMAGNRMRHLRESEAFYRWLLAAAVNERLFQDESAVDQDSELFARCNAIAETNPLFRDIAAQPADEENRVGPIGRTVRDYKEDWRVWEFAQSEAVTAERRDFLRLARGQNLRFAQDIQYADAQAGGVGIFNLLFGFRRVAANLVWIEVDRYWHQGNMHRMMSLMRTCVALDPHFIEAYLIGAWHLAYNATARMPDTPWPQREWHPRYQVCIGEKERFYYVAIDFLKDGIRRNPRNYRLYFDLGFAIYKQKLDDLDNAIKYLREAILLPHDRWVPRQLFICLEENGQYEEALAGWIDYKERFPGTMIALEVAPRFILRNQGKIYEERMQELRAAARTAAAPAETQRLIAEAEDYQRRARDIWAEEGTDFGAARKLYMDAMALREQDRHMEAVALLDKGRWDSAHVWQEFSDQIIALKQEAGIPLSVSEKKAVLRENEVGICKGMPPEERERRLRLVEEQEAAFL